MGERVYCPEAGSSQDEGRSLLLTGDEARHLGRVRRVRAGEVVEVFDGRGFARAAEVIEAGKERVLIRPTGPPLPDRVAAFELTLATAVPKGDRFDWLVEKATELGVARLVPILTERSVVDPRGAKLDRLRRAVVEASKQCGRNRLMSIEAPTPWAAFAGTVSAATPRFLAHPGGVSEPAWPRRVGAVVAAVGPEGGFTDGEVAAALRGGWTSVGLGATLLRIETAGIVLSARLLGSSENSTAPAGDIVREGPVR